MLSGGRQLNLTWQKSPDYPNVYTAHVPDNVTFTTLFVNGVRQIRARYPNGDPQEMAGLCYYQSQQDDEGCTAYDVLEGPLERDDRLKFIDLMNQGK